MREQKKPADADADADAEMERTNTEKETVDPELLSQVKDSDSLAIQYISPRQWRQWLNDARRNDRLRVKDFAAGTLRQHLRPYLTVDDDGVQYRTWQHWPVDARDAWINALQADILGYAKTWPEVYRNLVDRAIGHLREGGEKARRAHAAGALETFLEIQHIPEELPEEQEQQLIRMVEDYWNAVRDREPIGWYDAERIAAIADLVGQPGKDWMPWRNSSPLLTELRPSVVYKDLELTELLIAIERTGEALTKHGQAIDAAALAALRERVEGYRSQKPDSQFLPMLERYFQTLKRMSEQPSPAP